MAQALPTTNVDAASAFPRSICLLAPGKTEARLSLARVNELLDRGEGCLWVDVDTSDPRQVDLFKEIHGLHPLSIEDVLNRKSRPKLEEYPKYLFIVILGLRLHEATADPYDLETFDLCFFLGPRFLITTHAGASTSIDDVASRIEKNPDLLARGADRLAQVIMDGAVDDYFPLLDKIDEFIDGLEQRVIERFDQTALPEIFAVKRLVISLRRHIGPEREVFNILTNRPSALLSPESQLYFRDIYDHVLRINDSVETFRDLLSSVLDSYLTQISNRLGRVTKGLSVIATLSIPFVVVSGMWGMNVPVPFATHHGAFWWMLAVQLALGLVLLLLLRFRNFL